MAAIPRYLAICADFLFGHRLPMAQYDALQEAADIIWSKVGNMPDDCENNPINYYDIASHHHQFSMNTPIHKQ